MGQPCSSPCPGDRRARIGSAQQLVQEFFRRRVHRVATPGHVTIRPHQDEIAFVQLTYLGIVNLAYRQGNIQLGKGGGR